LRRTMEKSVTKTVDKKQGSKKSFIEPVWKKCKQVIDFVKDTRKELFNVSWPGRKEVIATTGVVIVAVFFFGFFLFLVDFLVSNGMNFILKMK
jgi:preprotein translocase subunit SecE